MPNIHATVANARALLAKAKRAKPAQPQGRAKPRSPQPLPIQHMGRGEPARMPAQQPAPVQRPAPSLTGLHPFSADRYVDTMRPAGGYTAPYGAPQAAPKGDAYRAPTSGYAGTPSYGAPTGDYTGASYGAPTGGSASAGGSYSSPYDEPQATSGGSYIVPW